MTPDGVGQLAERFFSTHPDLLSFADVGELEAQMRQLEVVGLGYLNERLAASGQQWLDTVAEHNCAAELVRLGFTTIQYESPESTSPIDFAASNGSIRYRLEVKRLAARELEHQQDRAIRGLNRLLRSVSAPVVISLTITPAFAPRDIHALFRHMRNAIASGTNRPAYHFPSETDQRVAYSLYPSTVVSSPKIIAAADRDVTEVTGIDASRVHQKVRDAYDKFRSVDRPSVTVVNLLVLEALRTVPLSSVADGLYGTEVHRFGRGGVGRARQRDGAFSAGHHSRLTGVMLVRRELYRLFCSYEKLLFPHPRTSSEIRQAIVDAFGVVSAFGPDSFP
ncbi:MAG: hypothetical protein ACE5MI_14235 [Acidimicrobiia bacterium]